MDYVREGDTLVVTKLDRLARSILHLWEIVQGLDAKGVALRILNLGGETVDTRGATGRLTLNVFAAFAQFEREMMLERQREGIAKAKVAGKYKGRKPTARAKANDAVHLFRQGQRVSEIAKALRIRRGSVYRALDDAGVGPGVIATRSTQRSRRRSTGAPYNGRFRMWCREVMLNPSPIGTDPYRKSRLSLNVLKSVTKKYRATALGWADFFGQGDLSEPIREKAASNEDKENKPS